MSLHLTQSAVYMQATTSEPEHCYHSVRGSLSGCAAWEINCLNCENKGKKLFNYSSARSPDSGPCHQHGLAFHTITVGPATSAYMPMGRNHNGFHHWLTSKYLMGYPL